MTEKLCVFCRHCEMDHTGAYGDYPEAATMQCGKGYWSGITDYGEMTNFRARIIVAKDCPDYSPAKTDPRS